ncbi:MAG TPA: cyclopropane-fatty-acyl-phospholipid synthase family protein [Vineibacter sp.]|nr:cyclopropane-fatty-acyl-phospholipid synthase family protein [Vineibacter sp.]
MLLAKILRGLVRTGTLTLVDAAGRTHRVEGSQSGPDVTVRFHDHATPWRLALSPRLAIGEAYMDGRLTVDDGRLVDFLDLLGRNMAAMERSWWLAWSFRVQRFTRWIQQRNPIGRAQRNVAHHYDLNGALYALFLDRDRQYSCAYFPSPEATLEVAQAAKKRHILSKLRVEPTHKVLDIGSGWGGLGLYIARESGADVTGVTLSSEQHVVSTQRAATEGQGTRVNFKLQDYRLETQRYDRIVSVGMFEHVGAVHYDEYFGKVRDLLTDDGVMVLHSIGRMEPPGGTNPWIRKYIFPGGYTPALSEVLASIERVGLWVTDIEILRLHYAETLRHWRDRFMQNREEVKRLAGLDDRFCRMWEFYLAACEMSFRHMNQMVFQIQLAKRVDTVPLTRDYMYDAERATDLPLPRPVAAE